VETQSERAPSSRIGYTRSSEATTLLLLRAGLLRCNKKGPAISRRARSFAEKNYQSSFRPNCIRRAGTCPRLAKNSAVIRFAKLAPVALLAA